jgi:hypothetical protein
MTASTTGFVRLSETNFKLCHIVSCSCYIGKVKRGCQISKVDQNASKLAALPRTFFVIDPRHSFSIANHYQKKRIHVALSALREEMQRDRVLVCWHIYSHNTCNCQLSSLTTFYAKYNFCSSSSTATPLQVASHGCHNGPHCLLR